MTQLPKDDIRTTATLIGTRAAAANDQASAALRRAEDITGKLTGASQLSQRPAGQPAGVAVQEILMAENAARQVPLDIPEIRDKINTVDALMQRTDTAARDLGNKLAELRKQIESARSLAGRVCRNVFPLRFQETILCRTNVVDYFEDADRVTFRNPSFESHSKTVQMSFVRPI